ncbi:MAG: septal ring lytic transglycosylase RlpA family protein [Verrucomicrobiales bacterium]|nr:septal ring lytic transglycosylase RlpA family protein [Verrucomicrobiales bacterium]
MKSNQLFRTAALAVVSLISGFLIAAEPGEVLKGQASFYSKGFVGKKTASGELYDPASLTAAHRTLPFGTMVHVTNLKNGKTVVVRINNRGPFTKNNRIIDLSLAAAEKVAMTKDGVVDVKVVILEGAE